MADIATLGLAVDSSQIDKGKISLDQLSGAAQRAQAAQMALSSASKASSAAAVASARAAHQEAVSKTSAARATETATKADIANAVAAQRKARSALDAARADHTKKAAAHAAATAADKQAAASAKVAAAQDREAASALKAAGAQHKAAAANTASMAAANDNAHRMSGSMSGLAAQFQDIGVTAAMGMNPLIIGLQQGTQIAGQMEAAIQGGGTATSVLTDAFKSLLQPLTFASIALTVLAAAGLQFVDWVWVGQTALNGLADALVVIAPYAAMAAAGLALLYAPTIIGGIVSVIALLGRMTTAALTAAVSMAAANPAGALVLGIVAAVTAANIFRDEITQIFGVDIVGAAKTGANFVIGSFVAAYEDLKFVWNSFPAIVGSAAIGAANAVIGGMNAMIGKATELLNGFIERVNGMLGSLPFGMGEGIAIPSIGDLSVGTIENGFADQLIGAVGARNQAVSDALNRDYLGDFGTSIAKGASAAADKLRELAAGLGETEKAKKGARSEAEKLAEKYNDILLDAENFIASKMAERDALFLTEEAAAALRYEQELLNKAMQAGIVVDAAKANELRSYAAAMAAAEVETNRVREALDFGKDLVNGFVSDLRSGLEQGKGFWKSFGDAAMNVLDKIVDKLLNNVIDALFQVNSVASGMGGGGGLLGMLGGLFGGGGGGGFTGFERAWTAAVPGLYAKGGAFPTGIGGFSNTVVNRATPFMFAKGAGIMGEAGPEAIMPLKRGPDGSLGVRAQVANQSHANQNVRVEVEVFLNDDGTLGAIASSAGRDAAVTVVQANNKARQKHYQNGGQFG